MRYIILWTWCLPQSLFGLLFASCLKIRGNILCVKNHKKIRIITIRDNRLFGGVSLGAFIFLTKRTEDELSLMHEYGHTIQGYILGPLYLLVVGIPSVGFLWVSKWKPGFGQKYYRRFPENWADKLSGISR